MPGLYGNVGNTTVSGGNTTSLYNTSTYVTVSNNINVNDINASGNLFVAGTGTFGGNVTAPNFIGNLTGNVSGNISGNVVAPGSNTQVIYNDSGSLGADPDFTWNESTNTLTVTGAITATGNVSGAYILGNGSQLTGLPATYGNADVQNYLANGFGSNTIVTTGNISAGYFLGNGSQLTGIVSSYGNANVAAYLPTYTGNLAGGNLAIGNNATINNDLTVGGTIFGTFSGNITGNLVVPGANTQVIFNNAGNAGASADFTFNDATDILAVNGSISLTKTPEARISGSEDLRIFAAAAQDLYLSNPSMPMANIWLDAQDIRLARTLGGSDTNVIVTGQITTTGNVTGANIIGNGQYLTNLPGANVTGTVANATYATSAGSATTATHALTANTVTDAAQGNITSLGTLTALTVGGDQNITGNLIVGQNLTVNGNTIQVNITELNVQDPIIGLGRGENNAPLTSNDGKDRGEQLWYYAGSEKSAFTGYDNSAGNLILATDVAIANEIVSVTAWGTTETGALYAHGNITGDYVFGNAAFMTGIPAQYGDSNVTTLLAAFGSNTIATTGNVTAGYFFGDGSGLTNINAGNIVGSYGNANVANFLANYGSNTIVTTGNISGGNVIGTFLYGDGTNITGVVAGAASTRIEVKNTSGVTITKGTPVYATGTVGASTIIEIAASRADTASTMPCLGLLAQDLNNNDQGYAISVGTLTSTNTNGFTTGQELYVAAAGGLTASRPTGTNIVQTVGIVGRVNASNGSIEVNVWNVNGLPNLGNGNVWIGNANGFPTQQVAYGDANVAAYLPTYTGNLAGGNITVTGVYYGNGSGLTSLTGANVTGTVANATYATSAGSAGTATTAVTVTGNAQANITSVGTLTTLTVSGNIGTGGILTDNYYYANGTPISFGGTYGNANVSNFLANGFGSNTITTTGNITSGNIDVTGVLFNSANANVTIQDNVIVVGNLSVSNLSRVNIGTVTLVNDSGSPSSLDIQATSVDFNGLITTSQGITATGNIQGSYFIGNGSQLTGILTSPLSANLDTNNFSIVNSAGANVSIADDLNVSGNIYTGSLKSVWVGSVEMLNNSGAPAGIIIRGGVEVDGNINVKGATINQGNVFIEDAAGVLFADADNSNYIGLKGPSVTAANVTFTLPNADGGSGQVLSTYGNGVMYWQSTTSGYGNANVSNFLANGFGSNTITTTGNITASNLNATTAVVVSGSAGNITGANYITGNFFVGNGSQLTGITTSLSGNLAGNIAANGFFINGLTAITITGNANVGNLGTTAVVATGAITGSTTLAITGNANVGNLGTAGVVTATGNVTGGNVIATGTVKSGAVTITGTDGTNGQVLTTYGNGITYFSTVSGGGGSPGGADTQIQFNDSSAFAGNAQMTFSKTTGNAAFGNLVIQTTNPNNAAVITNVNALNASARPLLARIAIGSGFNGDFGNTGDYFNTTRNSAVTSMNRFDVSSTSNTTPMAGTSVATWFNNTSGNTITSAGNARGMTIDTFYTGSRWGTAGAIGGAQYNGLRIHAIAGNGSSAGNVATLAGLNLTTGTAGSNSTINDNINLVINQTAAVSGANNGNVYGVTFNMNSSNPTVGNTYLIHNQAASSGTHNSNWGIGGNFRSAARYFMLRNDDDVAQVKLGSLRNYHEFLGNTSATSGTVTLNPRATPTAQVVRTTPTAAITTVEFAGFITSASDGTNTDFQTDTLTWIIQQGATPYAVTLPTGNAQIKYAGGVSTIGTTANAVTMCAITAYDNAGTTNYLVTISPEFT